MPNINIDELESTKPITLTIDGVEYTVVPITMALMEKINAPATGKDGVDKRGYTAAHKQLALFFGVPIETFRDTDLRKIKAAVERILGVWTAAMDTITENPTQAAEEPK